MAFNPRVIYEPRLPKLRPGFFIQIGAKFYQIQDVRENNQFVDLVLGYADTAPLIINSTTNAIYQGMTGNVDQSRVIHIQYLALTTAIGVLLRWGTDPLLSKWINIYLTANAAGLTNPLTVDRWSYGIEMRFSASTAGVAGAQLLWFNIVEYTVVAYDGTPPKKFLRILDNGMAVFIEAG